MPSEQIVNSVVRFQLNAFPAELYKFGKGFPNFRTVPVANGLFAHVVFHCFFDPVELMGGGGRMRRRRRKRVRY